MRRWMDHHKSIAENYESDESVSEEEEDCEDHVQGGWSITLGETTEKKGRGQVLSQLEILRDARGLEHLIGPSNTPQKRDKLLCIQDGVDDKRQLTCLADRVSTCTSDEENISDEEVLKENNRFLVRYISSGCGNFQKVNFPVSRIARNDDEWSAVNREVEELVHVTENARCSSTAAIFSKLSKSGKGVRDKAKPKFSFHLQSHKNVSGDTSMPLLEAYKSIKPVTAEQSMSDLLKKFFKGGKIEQSNIHSVQDDVSVGENYTKDSMAVLLDSFRENNALHQGDTKVISSTKERLRLAVKRNIRSLGDRTLDGDESPDILDTDSSTSSDNKVFNQNPEHIIPESKRKKSMADQFQEAIGVASARDEENSFVLPTHLGTGLFGKLQHVIQNEKERDIKFMKQLQSQACLEGSYFDVKISSRWLEGKLTVCSCTFIRHKEDSQLVDNCQIELKTGRAYTIMFSSRSCGDVELEVGNLIRIYPPWKNVSVVEKNEIVILSTYFSQI
ncbi:uncharacterized protein LOC141695033 isoform X1 [Apium graveolens]|uniref:uncharacterized protein LOC141695033 isoform X1 n=1 Tax=Apium graveolens TaxID=4045 RepID=UPI003D7AE19F